MRRPKRNQLLASIVVGACMYVWVFGNLNPPRYPMIIRHLSKSRKFDSNDPNYFQPEWNSSVQSLTGNYVVNQKFCKIPEVKLWSKEATMDFALFLPPEPLKRANGSLRGLTFVNKTRIVINETLAKSLNLSVDRLECCYQEILTTLSKKVNFSFWESIEKRLTDDCVPIFHPWIAPKSTSLQVSCFNFSEGGRYTEIHTDFHILPTVRKSDSRLAGKLEYWKEKKQLPPNLYILDLDCGTRFNIRRQMPLTVKFLQDLGATEMHGYTKIGPHNGCDLRPPLTLFPEDLLGRVGTSDELLDNCTMIIPTYSQANYVTSFFEDGSGLKLKRDRFLLPWADFSHVVWARFDGKYGLFDVHNVYMENKTIYEVMLEFNENLAEVMADFRLPYIAVNRIGCLADSYFNGYQLIDKYLRDSLQRLNSSGHLENTVFILVGDHGFVHDAFRDSVPGWYEDKMPALWISLPPKLTKLRPELKKALEYNSGQLSSPFDLYQTLQHVVQLTNGAPLEESSLGSSLLVKLQDRNCSQTGIHPGYCTCTVLLLLPFQSIQRPFLQEASRSALDDPNFSLDSLPKNKICMKVRLEGIVGAAVMSKTYQEDLTEDQLESLVTSGENDLLLTLATSAFSELTIIIQVILNYDNNKSTSPFKVVHSDYSLTSANADNEVTYLGYHACRSNDTIL